MAEPTLLETPLFDWHQSHGGRIVEFGGWRMPVQYSTIVDEHQAVRQRVGVFDISHITAKLRWRIERDYEVLKSELGLAHFEGEAGAASIITQPCASPLMDSLSANERRFPPQAPGGAKHLAYPPVPDPETRRRSDPNGISKTRSQQSEDNSRSRWLEPSCAARVRQAFPARPPMPQRPPYRGSS